MIALQGLGRTARLLSLHFDWTLSLQKQPDDAFHQWQPSLHAGMSRRLLKLGGG